MPDRHRPGSRGETWRRGADAASRAAWHRRQRYEARVRAWNDHLLLIVTDNELAQLSGAPCTRCGQVSTSNAGAVCGSGHWVYVPPFSVSRATLTRGRLLGFAVQCLGTRGSRTVGVPAQWQRPLWQATPRPRLNRPEALAWACSTAVAWLRRATHLTVKATS